MLKSLLLMQILVRALEQSKLKFSTFAESLIHFIISYYSFSHRYYTDPSGTFWQCNAKAIGSGSEGADSSLQEQYNKVYYKPVILLENFQ